ncbi:major facilitator superfamily domain-containing protein [Mycena crocata]|nr:major facilitator superfamily domain-containing protein [Mycena crocata]
MLERVARNNIEHAAPTSGVDANGKPKSWKNYIWDSLDKPKEEQRLLLKADLIILTFGCLGTFIKWMDRANLNSAFVSGMKEDLNLYGNELNYAQTIYSLCCLLAVMPIQMLLTRVHPRILIPSIELAWTIVTFGHAKMKTAQQMYALRALLGIFETGHFSAVVYLAGGWYTKNELGRRLSIINMATSAGPMFGSFLQAAVYKGLDGRRGLKGWEWLFIIDGAISLAIVLPQFFLLPDLPARQTPNFIFSAAEVELARDRNVKEGRVRQGAFTWAQLKSWLVRPELYMLWALSVFNSIGYKPSDTLALWLKAWNTQHPKSFTVPQINNYAAGLPATIILMVLIGAWASDTVFRGRRWPTIVIAGLINGTALVILAATPVFPTHRGFRWFLYYLTGTLQSTSSMFWAWTQETFSGDPGARSFASGMDNALAYLVTATVPLAVFQIKDQPAIVSGNWTAAACCFASPITALCLAYYQHKQSILDKSIDESESQTSSQHAVAAVDADDKTRWKNEEDVMVPELNGVEQRHR